MSIDDYLATAWFIDADRCPDWAPVMASSGTLMSRISPENRHEYRHVANVAMFRDMPRDLEQRDSKLTAIFQTPTVKFDDRDSTRAESDAQ